MANSRSPLLPSRQSGRLRFVSALVLVAGLVLSACGSTAKVPPKQAVNQAVSNLRDQSKLSVRITLALTADQVQQLSKRNSSSGMTTAQASAVSRGAIFFDAQTGHGEALSSAQAATDKANAYDFGLQIGGDTPIELRYVDQAIYLRVQLSTLLPDLGISSDQAASFQSDLDQANAYVPGLSALGQGSWVEISQASIQSIGALLKQYASSLGSSGAAVNPGQAKSVYGKLAHDVVNAIQANSTYQELGNQGGATEYSVTLNVHGFLDQMGPVLQSDLASLPGGVGSKISSEINDTKAKIPANQTAVVDLFVKDNQVQELDIDLNQFATDKAASPVPVHVVFGSGSSITAPSGATPLDLSKLPSLVSGLLGGMAHSSTGTTGA